MPVADCVGCVSVHVGMLKVLTAVPPLNVAVSVKLIAVPQTNAGEVVKRNGC